MNTEKRILCERLVRQILPQGGDWSTVCENNEQLNEYNIPFNATDKEWMAVYVFNNAQTINLSQYGLDIGLVKEFILSRRFDTILKEYQEKIVDFQLGFAKKYDKTLVGIKDANTYVSKLFNSVKTTLVRGLGMDKHVVNVLLAQKQDEEIKYFKPFTEISYNTIYCEDIYESQR